jgi:hypothetical protein
MNKILKHPLWSSVVASLIVAAILAFVPGLFSGLVEVFTKVFKWLGTSTPVWNWLLLALIALSIAFFATIALIAFVRVLKKIDTNKYIKDTFMGFVWRWRINENEIYDIVPFCPKCDMQIYPKNVQGPRYLEENKVRIECDDCRGFAEILNYSPDDLIDHVRRQIEKNIRTGEWRNRIKA